MMTPIHWLAPLLLGLMLAAPARAEIGQIKVAKGQVTVERAGQALPGQVGLRLEAQDVVRTGADGSVGITMRDDSLLSAGPNSIVALERFDFEPTTQAGRFDSRLDRGTLAVLSGRLAKQSPQAVTVRTPSAVLGVRGTEFVVAVEP
ncbi:MAG: FecR domain-containing protein [Burkholderiales bacterium]|nr:FecR domain-containing protein [Burkholderiales bacterium]